MLRPIKETISAPIQEVKVHKLLVIVVIRVSWVLLETDHFSWLIILQDSFRWS